MKNIMSFALDINLLPFLLLFSVFRALAAGWNTFYGHLRYDIIDVRQMLIRDFKKMFRGNINVYASVLRFHCGVTSLGVQVF